MRTAKLAHTKKVKEIHNSPRFVLALLSICYEFISRIRTQRDYSRPSMISKQNKSHLKASSIKFSCLEIAFTYDLEILTSSILVFTSEVFRYLFYV